MLTNPRMYGGDVFDAVKGLEAQKVCLVHARFSDSTKLYRKRGSNNPGYATTFFSDPTELCAETGTCGGATVSTTRTGVVSAVAQLKQPCMHYMWFKPVSLG